ncbi:outer membrane beta-barrel protein [Hymenobacter caeli]|uniref:Outer membrane receptor protein involved in Fe transport n=1 Tax=Hymenobacter caeli TaxID=2735894 RepID=A0ABX2FL86_9BACT|nr:outer membrane beta-barrel protein [Hymenobacter caeli]NRT17881.1 outer membrane receptor protein involved in Fe transport [Hymenobacter caeli]
MRFCCLVTRCAWVVWTLLAVPRTGLGQARGGPAAAVRGTVAGPGGPLAFATVTLHRAADSVVVKAEFSDGSGAYRLEAAPGGRYRVSAVQVGYQRRWSPAFELPAAGLALAPLELVHSAGTALKEVSVTATRPPFEHLPDRTVVNVEGTALAAGATTLDLLARAPGVSVTDDNLGLRGRQGLLVLVDGKRLALSGTELADYLRALPAEQLRSIELITNPPARYDAQGTAGVIALNLKKDLRLGTNGSANASYGRGEYGKFTAGGALNHRTQHLNAFGSYAYADRRGFTRNDVQRQFAPAGGPASSSVLADDLTNHLRSHSLKAGLDYTLSARTLLGAAVSGLLSQVNSDNANQTAVYDGYGTLANRYHSTTTQDVRRPNGTANLNLRHAFADSAGAPVLTADADYARYDTHRRTGLATAYDAPAAPADFLAGDQRSALTLATLRADYSRPLPHRVRLEAGAKVAQVRSDNDVAFDRIQNGVTTPDANISGSFRYDENVNAAYASLSRPGARATLQAGLRAEQTNTRGRQPANALDFERHYFQLFPSASVQYTLGKEHALGLALSRRINRPVYNQVNPLRNYVDATSYSSGNPGLGPETSYNAELTHTFRQKFTAGLSYARTDQPILRVQLPAPDGNRLVVSQPVNLGTEHYYALTLTAPLAPRPWWALYGNAVLSYTRFAGTLPGTDGSSPYNNRPALLLSANNTFTGPQGWSAELSGTFESGETFAFETLRPRGQVAAGVQKSLWAKQGTLRLAVADAFYTTPIRSTSTYANFSESFFLRQDSRFATLAFTYRFGSAKVAGARKRAAGAEEELRRAAGQ